LALRDRVLDPRNWKRLPVLYRTLRKHVETDLTWTEALPFLALLPRIDLQHLRFYRIRPPLVAYWRTPEGAYVAGGPGSAPAAPRQGCARGGGHSQRVGPRRLGPPGRLAPGSGGVRDVPSETGPHPLGARADWLLVLGQDYDPCFDPAQPVEEP